MATQPTSRFTPAEYLAFERAHELRHEYLAGDVYQRHGSSRNHNRIVRNLSRQIATQLLERPCEIYTNDLRVRVTEDSYFYPDAVIVCGKQEFLDAEVDTLLNPTVVVEVLSESTERFDRGKKFAKYRQLDSLEEYLLIDSAQMHIEHYVRQPDDKWLLEENESPPDSVELPSVGCHLSLAETYEKCEF